MSDLVVCGECGTRYDSDQNAFCPRCGSTEQGKVLPVALQVARRNDPGRRRVQAAGALLLLVGLLFLVSSLVGLAVPTGEVAKSFVEPMADQPGGSLVLVPGGDAPYDVAVTTVDGETLANATAHAGPFNVSSPDHGTLRIRWANATASGNATAIVIAGDRLHLELADAVDGHVHVGPTLATTVQVGRVVFVAVALVLIGGGVAALALRAWGLAAAAALVGILLAAVVLVGFLLAGLLFALPFGVAAYLILRGRRHFRGKGE